MLSHALSEKNNQENNQKEYNWDSNLKVTELNIPVCKEIKNKHAKNECHENNCLTYIYLIAIYDHNSNKWILRKLSNFYMDF